jgi:hypothetical protein
MYEDRRILIASSILGNVDISNLDICLGIRLKKHGASVAFLICEGSLSACSLCEKERFLGDREFARKGPGHTCTYCLGYFNAYIHNHFPVFTYAHASETGKTDIESWIHKFLFTLNRAPESKVAIIAHPNYPETTTVGGLKDYHVTPERILNTLIESDMIENKLLNRNRQTYDNLQGSPTNVFNPF